MEESVADIGEDALIARLLEGNQTGNDVIIGPGDDCAVVESGGTVQLLKTDCVIESVHFLPGTDPEKVGWKAMCRVISDIAAMGGMPEHALVTIAVDEQRSVNEVAGWYRGMNHAAREFGNCVIVGGETASLPGKGALISISMTGSVSGNRYVTRSGARPGDLVAVTGRLGGSFDSGRHLDFRPRLREANWLAARNPEQRPTAMMDLSDGLSKDLPKLADQSQITGYQIDLDKLPVHEDSDLESAIGEGEDYELLTTIPPGGVDQLLKDWKTQFPDCLLTVIGAMTGQDERTSLDGGWEHF